MYPLYPTAENKQKQNKQTMRTQLWDIMVLGEAALGGMEGDPAAVALKVSRTAMALGTLAQRAAHGAMHRLKLTPLRGRCANNGWQELLKGCPLKLE